MCRKQKAVTAPVTLDELPVRSHGLLLCQFTDKHVLGELGHNDAKIQRRANTLAGEGDALPGRIPHAEDRAGRCWLAAVREVTAVAAIK